MENLFEKVTDGELKNIMNSFRIGREQVLSLVTNWGK